MYVGSNTARAGLSMRSGAVHIALRAQLQHPPRPQLRPRRLRLKRPPYVHHPSHPRRRLASLLMQPSLRSPHSLHAPSQQAPPAVQSIAPPAPPVTPPAAPAAAVQFESGPLRGCSSRKLFSLNRPPPHLCPAQASTAVPPASQCTRSSATSDPMARRPLSHHLRLNRRSNVSTVPPGAAVRGSCGSSANCHRAGLGAVTC